jgi:hypothetical protein
MQRGVEKWIGQVVHEPKSRQINTEEGRKAIIEAKDCFVWKGMEEDGVT